MHQKPNSFEIKKIPQLAYLVKPEELKLRPKNKQKIYNLLIFKYIYN